MRAERILKISGGHNFRDMGGYATADGRSVKWGTLYRSGVMSKIDPSERAQLESLGIRSICDLRTPKERSQHPTVWHQDMPVEMISRDYEMSAGALRNLIKTREATGEAVEAYMRNAYSTLLAEQADSYVLLFRRLAEGKVPLLFNCAAGKDRTGIAAALILSLLGVSREDIMADYALTNEFIEGLIDLLSHDDDYGDWFSEDPEAAMPLLRAEPHYIENMFRALDEDHGGLRPYLATMLHVGEPEIEAIRAHLLE